MDLKHDARHLSVFRVTTTETTILHMRHNITGRAAVSTSEREPYRPCSGVRFELGEPAAVNFIDGGDFTGGIVVAVEQIDDPQFEPGQGVGRLLCV